MIEAIFCLINKVSETNKLKKDSLVGNSYLGTIGSIQLAKSLAELGAININIFDECREIDLDREIDELDLKDVNYFLSLGYSNFDIENFKSWVKQLLKVDGRYKIFQRIN